MAWLDTHSITDFPIAYRATRSAKMADTDLALVDADLSTVAVAKAACISQANSSAVTHVSERQFGINCSRGMQACSDQGGTFGSTFTALYASLPTNANGNKALFVAGA